MTEEIEIIKFSSIVEANGKTIRENNLEIQHKYPIDTLVEIKYDTANNFGSSSKVHARLFVCKHARDCDGTPLYWFSDTPTNEWLKHPNEVFFDEHDNPRRNISLERLCKEAHSVICNYTEDTIVKVVEQTREVLYGYDRLTWKDEKQ